MENRKVHTIKLDPIMFDLVMSGQKTFEFRKNDRDYKSGDQIWLQEFDRETQTYSGREIRFIARHILYSPEYGLPEGTCIISMGPTDAVMEFAALRQSVRSMEPSA